MKSELIWKCYKSFCGIMIILAILTLVIVLNDVELFTSPLTAMYSRAMVFRKK